MLPWPRVRDRILQITTLPIHARAPVARDDMPNVVMRIKNAMIDSAGEVRVWGSNPFDEGS